MAYQPPYAIHEILRLKSEGQTHSQIGQHFGRSGSLIGHILKVERLRALSAERSQAIRTEIRASNDIGRRLPMDDLFCVLNPIPRVEAILRRHFKRQGIEALSLLDMMDFLIPVVEDAKGSRACPDYEEYLRYMPAYRVKNLGQILYAAMIKAMSAVDCGEAFRVEWTARKKRLRDHLIGRGGFYPYILNGKNAALKDV
jgi:hypothetical protein